MANQSQRRSVPIVTPPTPLSESSEVIEQNPDSQGRDGERRIKYDALDTTVDCIRLLVIESWQGGSWREQLHKSPPIICSMYHATFAEKPKYEAISYTWGDENKKENIQLNGILCSVGVNLVNALKLVRKEQERRIVWVDALCIDQSNVSERSSQLKIMPYIYRKAQAVLVCLAQSEIPDECFEPAIGDDKTGGYIWTGELCVEHLSQNDYWHRLWIIQEISLARKLFVHHPFLFDREVDFLDWDFFIEALIKHGGLEDCIALKLQKQIDNKYADGHKLKTLLYNHQDALCKEPRDKIVCRQKKNL